MALVPYPFIGGFFNILDPLFKIQFYIWLIIGLIILAVICEVVWRVTLWGPMTPFHGLWYAFVRRSNAAFVFDLKLNWDLLSEGGAKLIFDKSLYDIIEGKFNRFRMWLFNSDFSTQIAKKMQGDWEDAPLATIGRTPTDLILDINHWTDAKSVDREKIARCAEIYNEMHENDQIHSLVKFFRYATSEPPRIVCKDLELFKTIPWSRIDQAFPLQRSESAWGGFLRQLAEDLQAKGQNDLNKWAAVILIFSAGVIILMFLAKFFKII